MGRRLAVLLFVCAVALGGCDTQGSSEIPDAAPDVLADAPVVGDAALDVPLDVGAADAPDDAGGPDVAVDVPLDVGPDAAPDAADVGPDIPDVGWRCEADADCSYLLENPDDPCRSAACETATGACRVEEAPDGTACDDGNPCTAGTVCGGGVCDAGAAVGCDDGDACTTDTCTVAAGCVHTVVADCCHTDADCDDGNACTSDRCPDTGAFCKHLWIDGCCATDADCADGDPCTADACTPDGCAWTSICCEADADCDDGRECTSDRCLDGMCVAVTDAVSECCEPDVLTVGFDSGGPEGFAFLGGAGAVGWHVVSSATGATGAALYYGDPARKTYDSGGANSGTATSPAFVLPERAGAELRFRLRMDTESYFEKLHVDLVVPTGTARLYTNSTGNYAWIDVAVDISGAAGLPARIVFAFEADSSIFYEGVYIDDIRIVSDCALRGCALGTECDDTNRCTADICGGDGVCGYDWIEGCCIVDVDCDDGNPCTRDRCQANACVHDPTGDPSCCLADEECADDDPCTNGECVGFVCEIGWLLDVCPISASYTETFDSARTFGAVGWEAVDLVADGPTNWVLRGSEAPFGSPFVRFDYAPDATDYEHCLRSPPVDLPGARDLIVAFDHRFSSFVGADAGNRLEVRWSTDDWATSQTLWAWAEAEGDISFERRALALSVSPLAPHVAIAFCVSGLDSFEINYWDVDDVQVLAGEPPDWVYVPEAIAAPAGETTTIEVLAEDPDDDPLSFALGADAPSWASITPTGGGAAELVLAPEESNEGAHVFTLLVDDGGSPVERTVSVLVSLMGETVLYEADFATGSPEELGWEVGSDPGSSANDWVLVNGEPFGSRHARFASTPLVDDFSDTFGSPAIDVAGTGGVRVRWMNELRATGDGVADPAVTVALQVSPDGGLWQTVWTHAETAGDLAPGPRSVDLTDAIAGSEAFRLRFRIRGGRSTAIDRWAIDDVVVFGR